MTDVAAQAGVSKGTSYLYFDSKQAPFITLHEEWDCGLADRVNAAIAALPEAGRRSPRQVLHAVAAAVAGHVLAETETCRVLMEARACPRQVKQDLASGGRAVRSWHLWTSRPAATSRLVTQHQVGGWHLAAAGQHHAE